jgi:hypothetical protein
MNGPTDHPPGDIWLGDRQWNDSVGGKPNNWEQNLSRYDSGHHTRTDQGENLSLSGRRQLTDYLNQGTAFYFLRLTSILSYQHLYFHVVSSLKVS